MKKILINLAGVLAIGVASLCAAPAFAIDAADGARTIDPIEATSLEDLQPTNSSENKEIAPTFAVNLEEDQRVVDFTMGHGRVLMGNNLTSSLENRTGLSFFLGNNLSLRPITEYGFLIGNTINFSGETVRDLYIVGNAVALMQDAKIGRDVFAAVNTLTVDTDIAGNLAVTADTLTLKDVKILGNLELEVAHLDIIGQVEVAGTFTYNDTADIAGLERIKANNSNPYHIDEPDPAAIFVARVYGEFFSIAALFLVMAVICALYPRLHDKIEQTSTVGRTGSSLALGLGVLIGVPVIAIFAFFTFIAAPLGIMALLLYIVAIYLAQGFAGAWLGHIVVEKLCKVKGNIFAEALIGIAIIGLISLIPYIGAIVNFLALLLGLGIILACIKPNKKSVEAKTEE